MGVSLGASSLLVYRFTLALGCSGVSDEPSLFDVESSGARDADARRAALSRLLASFSRRLSGAEATADVENGHGAICPLARR